MPFHESQECVYDDLGEGTWKWLEFFKHFYSMYNIGERSEPEKQKKL